MNLYYPEDVNSQSKSTWVFDALKKSNKDAVEYHCAHYDGKLGVFWSLGSYNYNLIKKYKQETAPWLFSDMPYFGRWMGKNRETCYWRIIPNDIHCYWERTDLPDDRFKQHNITVKDYDAKGDYILVCPSSWMVENYLHLNKWLDNTVAKIKQHTDRPIKVRQKPRKLNRSGPMVADIPFEHDCANAWAVVTSASLCAVEAAILGKPVICHELGPAAPIAQRWQDLEKPIYKPRENWLNTLSYYQYTEEEIASGEYRGVINC